MSKQTAGFVAGIVLCIALILMDYGDLVDLGGFVNGLAMMVVVFAILVFSSSMKDRKAKNG